MIQSAPPPQLPKKDAVTGPFDRWLYIFWKNVIDNAYAPQISVSQQVMSDSQTIGANEQGFLFGPLTIPSGVKLTVNGILYIDKHA